MTFLFLLIVPLCAYSDYESVGQSNPDLSQFQASTIETKIKISTEYHKAGNHVEDILMATEAVDSALQQNNTYLYAKALNHLGLLYRYHQQYADAIPLHKKAFDLTENLNIPNQDKMIFANNTGVACRHNHEYAAAVSYYLKALKLAEQENDLRNIEIACNGLGNALISIPNRGEEALSYLHRALETAKSTNNKLGIAMNYLTISDYYDHKGQYTISRNYLDDLLQVNQELEDTFGLAVTYQSIGSSYLNENKDLEKARYYYNRALKLFKTLNDNLKQAHVQYHLALISYKENDLEKSLENFEKSFFFAQSVKNKRLIMNSAEMISEIHEQRSDASKALTYYKIFQQYKDSINIAEQVAEITAINSRYNFEKKESEIEILKKNKAIQQSQLNANSAKLRNSGLIISLLSFSLFSLGLLVFLQYQNRKIKIKNEKQLQQQEKEKTQAIYEKNLIEAEMLATRMQVNPHFLFNCLNSIKYMIQINENEKANEYLIIFSRFIRIVLETSNKPINTICEEVELVRYYLQLEENRFNDDFSYSIENNLEGEAKGTLLPTLLLQPLLENAIWHGLLPSEKNKKRVNLQINPQENGIQIVIDDNGVGRKNAKVNKQHNSLGNKITQERIQLFNRSSPHTLELTITDKVDANGQAEGTRVTIFIKTNNASLASQPDYYFDFQRN